MIIKTYTACAHLYHACRDTNFAAGNFGQQTIAVAEFSATLN